MEIAAGLACSSRPRFGLMESAPAQRCMIAVRVRRFVNREALLARVSLNQIISRFRSYPNHLTVGK